VEHKSLTREPIVRDMAGVTVQLVSILSDISHDTSYFMGVIRGFIQLIYGCDTRFNSIKLEGRNGYSLGGIEFTSSRSELHNSRPRVRLSSAFIDLDNVNFPVFELWVAAAFGHEFKKENSATGTGSVN